MKNRTEEEQGLINGVENAIDNGLNVSQEDVDKYHSLLGGDEAAGRQQGREKIKGMEEIR